MFALISDPRPGIASTSRTEEAVRIRLARIWTRGEFGSKGHLMLPPRTLPLVVPRAMPLARPLPAAAPRPATPPLVALLGSAGVENLEDALEEVGGFSTKDVSVVLQLDQYTVHLADALGGKNVQKGSVRVGLGPRVEIAASEHGGWE